MPKNESIKKVLVLGSGPIIIGWWKSSGIRRKKFTAHLLR